MKHSAGSAGVQPNRHREPPPRSSWFGGGAPRDAKPPPPPACRLALPVALDPGEPEICLTSSDVDVLAQSDTEFLWRHGFRRVIPGAHEDIRNAVRTPRPLDALLARYHSRWPKEEADFVVPKWAQAEAEELLGALAQ